MALEVIARLDWMFDFGSSSSPHPVSSEVEFIKVDVSFSLSYLATSAYSLSIFLIILCYISYESSFISYFVSF